MAPEASPRSQNPSHFVRSEMARIEMPTFKSGNRPRGCLVFPKKLVRFVHGIFNRASRGAKLRKGAGGLLAERFAGRRDSLPTRARRRAHRAPTDHHRRGRPWVLLMAVSGSRLRELALP